MKESLKYEKPLIELTVHETVFIFKKSRRSGIFTYQELDNKEMKIKKLTIISPN